MSERYKALPQKTKNYMQLGALVAMAGGIYYRDAIREKFYPAERTAVDTANSAKRAAMEAANSVKESANSAKGAAMDSANSAKGTAMDSTNSVKGKVEKIARDHDVHQAAK